MTDFERVEVDEDAVEVRFARSDFAQVIFHDIAETYPTDANVCCAYTLTSSLTPNSRDWVGLYKVGWSTYRDYVYFEWATLPVEYQAGKTAESSIVFKGKKKQLNVSLLQHFLNFGSILSVPETRNR